MYLSYYNLKRKPFQINTDPRFLWLGEKHKEALATLKYGIQDSKGFLLLTGDIGTGKTTLINALLNSLEDNTVVASIPDPALTRLEFFQYIAITFGIRWEVNSKVDFLVHFSRFLEETAAEGRQVLLIIDEAQRLSFDLLEEIRLLSNIEKQHTKLLNIFFIGQNEFNHILEDPRSKALRQRITVNYHIETLSEEEVGDYIRHRLLIAGSRKTLFSPDAVHQVYLFSGGYPRLVNVICDRALLTGYVEDAKLIKGKIIKECAKELELPRKAPSQGTERKWWGGKKKKAHHTKHEIHRSTSRWRPVYAAIPALLIAGAAFAFFNYTDDVGSLPLVERQEIGSQYEKTAPAETGESRRIAALPDAERERAENRTEPEEGGRPPGAENAGAATASSPGAPEGASESANRTGDEELGIAGVWQDKAQAEQIESEAEASSQITEEPLPEEQLSTTSLSQEAVESGRIEQEDAPAVENSAASANQMAEETPPSRQRQATAKADYQKLDQGREFSLSDYRMRDFMINFEIDSNQLSEPSFRKLDRLAKIMVENPRYWAVVTGYTDTSGFYQYNKKISESRADMVKGYLVERGIEPHKIQTLGKGPQNPIASNETLAGRKLNRRVEIQLVKGN